MATLNDKQAQLLLGKNFGVLGTLREDGWPQVTPVWVDWDGEHVVINTLRSRAKPGHVERDPRVEIAVWSTDDPYQHVRVAGRAALVEEGAEEHIDKLSRKYLGTDYPWRSTAGERVIARITVDLVDSRGLDE